MRKSYLYYTVAVFALLAVTIEGCKKEDGFTNNSIIETPYGLYFADSNGVLYNTNNGDTIKPMVFPTDGYAPRALCVSGLNIIFVKGDLQVSTNNGINFNTSDTYINPSAYNQSLILNAADENRVYVSSFGVQIGDLGLAYSDSNGRPGTWHTDNFYDSSTIHHSSPVTITTLAQMTNNVIIGYDPVRNRVFAKYSKTDKWVERTGAAGATTNLPNNSSFTLGNFNNTVVAIDSSGFNGAYYSTDTGKTWKQYTGLPSGRALYAVSSPFNQVLLIGTSVGVYRLDNGKFTPSGTGITAYTWVRSITGKENILKTNNTVQQFVYAATNTGLYRSQDLGLTWTLVQKGNYVAAY